MAVITQYILDSKKALVAGGDSHLNTITLPLFTAQTLFTVLSP